MEGAADRADEHDGVDMPDLDFIKEKQNAQSECRQRDERVGNDDDILAVKPVNNGAGKGHHDDGGQETHEGGSGSTVAEPVSRVSHQTRVKCTKALPNKESSWLTQKGMKRRFQLVFVILKRKSFARIHDIYEGIDRVVAIFIGIAMAIHSAEMTKCRDTV